MNGPLKIYRTKQIVHHDFNVSLPDCMYKLKNLQALRNGMEERTQTYVSPSSNKVDILDQNNQNIPEMAALEARQEQILLQLAELKKQMDTIRKNLNFHSGSVQIPEIKTSKKQFQPVVLPDSIIVNASPSNPPYSLEIAQKICKSSFTLSVASYIHSTLPSIGDNAKAFITRLENFLPDPGVPKLNVKFIWKEVGINAELVVSQRPISGEVNILRYLSRLSCGIFNHEMYPNTHEIDTLLDASHSLLAAKTKTERTSLLQSLNKSLGKSKWLAGSEQISIADVAVYSVIKQLGCASDLTVNLRQWLERCASV